MSSTTCWCAAILFCLFAFQSVAAGQRRAGAGCAEYAGARRRFQGIPSLARSRKGGLWAT